MTTEQFIQQARQRENAITCANLGTFCGVVGGLMFCGPVEAYAVAWGGFFPLGIVFLLFGVLFGRRADRMCKKFEAK